MVKERKKERASEIQYDKRKSAKKQRNEETKN
jgi:hypothetical protein